MSFGQQGSPWVQKLGQGAAVEALFAVVVGAINAVLLPHHQVSRSMGSPTGEMILLHMLDLACGI